MNIFNRQLLRKNRNRCSKNFFDHNFLINEIASRMVEKITDLSTNFKSVLEIGARNGNLGKEIANLKTLDLLVQMDCSCKMIKLFESKTKLIADDDFLCFKFNCFDLIISNLNLHHVNDLKKFLLQVKNMLKNDGFFIASFFGQDTLQELRQTFYQVELENYQGASPRVLPFIDIKDAGMLLQKAGFYNPIADLDILKVSYPSVLKLIQDLKNMGEGNTLFKKSQKFISKKILSDLESKYSKLYSYQEDNTLINATFEVITIMGWKKT